MQSTVQPLLGTQGKEMGEVGCGDTAHLTAAVRSGATNLKSQLPLFSPTHLTSAQNGTEQHHS